MNITEVLKNFKRVVVLTGAGISIPSGIPTFENLDENWKYKWDRFEVFSRPFFNQEPIEFWKIYREIFGKLDEYSPNFLHRFVKSLDKDHEVVVATQNIDGLHTKAGSIDVVEMHGNASRVICLSCGTLSKLSEYSEIAPKCPECDVYLKPDVSLFFEGITGYAEVREEIRLSETLLIVIGAALNVGPVNELPFHVLRNNGSKSLWINMKRSPIGYDFDYELIGDFNNLEKDFLTKDLRENSIIEKSFDELLKDSLN